MDVLTTENPNATMMSIKLIFQINWRIFGFALILSFAANGSAQKLITRNASVHFFSSTPMENIEAQSNGMSAILDISNGQVAFQVPIRSFHFENALMEEHFNENYMESELHPKATFSGRLLDWDIHAFSAGEPVPVVAQGDFNCHGISDERKVSGTLSKQDDGRWTIEANFEVSTSVHGIPIPKVVRENIAEVIQVDLKAILEPK
ncbi:MAG: YceI family protein [Flavobacteriales bacterium]